MKNLYFAVILSLTHFFSLAQAPMVGFSSTVSGLGTAVDLVNAKDGSNRLFIVQQNGTVRILSGGNLLPTAFMNIAPRITYDNGGERGLLSIVFHPQFVTNRYFFAFYNNTAGNTELAQFQTTAGDPNTADTSTRKVLLTIIKPFTNHNGCKLNFGPDGNLYISTGDGGSGGDPNNNAQNLNSFLGKMLRINVDNFTTPPYYTVPATNPLVGMANTKPEIYQWGLRNPWRWSFDRLNGDMWIGDVGQGAWEEIDMAPAANTNGINYGWRCYEGTHVYDLSQCGTTPATGKTAPIFEYGHNNAGGFAVTGGYVYRGTEFPALQGYYFCADYVKPNGWLIKSNGAGGFTIFTQGNFPAGVSTFGEAEDGTLYLATLSGTVYKIFQSNLVALQLISFDAMMRDGRDLLSWRTTTDPSLDHFVIERSFDGTRFTAVGNVMPSQNNSDYSFSTNAVKADRYYRLKIILYNGTAQYSAMKKLSANGARDIIVSNLSRNEIQLANSVLLKRINIINAIGQQVKTIGELEPGTHTLALQNITAGVYYLKCVKETGDCENVKMVLY